jgi:hypothetical protein
MKAEIIDGRLSVFVKLRKPGPSSNGKTWLIASTRGPQYSDIKIMGKRLRISLNAFIDTPARKRVDA